MTPSVSSGQRRKLVLHLHRSHDEQIDLQLFRQTHVILHEHLGGSDVVEMIISGQNRPRVELEWPSLTVRWDRQLERKLAGLLGSEAVQVEPVDEREKAVAP